MGICITKVIFSVLIGRWEAETKKITGCASGQRAFSQWPRSEFGKTDLAPGMVRTSWHRTDCKTVGVDFWRVTNGVTNGQIRNQKWARTFHNLPLSSQTGGVIEGCWSTSFTKPIVCRFMWWFNYQKIKATSFIYFRDLTEDNVCALPGNSLGCLSCLCADQKSFVDFAL